MARSVDTDFLLETGKGEVSASKSDARRRKCRGGKTNARSELPDLPVEAVNETVSQATTSDDDDVGKEPGADVEVTGHDALGSQLCDRNDLVD